MEHWHTWLQLLPGHQAEIESKLAALAESLEGKRKFEAEYQAECRQREEEEHAERMARREWIDSVCDTLRAEFNAGLRKDKCAEMNHYVEAWPFWGEHEDEPTYPTSYHWLEAVFVWNGYFTIGRDKAGMYKKRYFDTIMGYEATSKQVEYAKLLRAKEQAQ